LKILFLIENYDSASGICIKEVAGELAHKGNSVTVLTQAGRRSNEQGNNEMNFDIITVRPDLLTSLSEKASSPTEKDIGATAKIMSAARRLQVVLTYPTWPLKSPFFSARFYKAAEKITREKQIDVIIPIYNTVEALIAGSKVKQKNRRVLYVPYFLDPLFGGQTPRFMSEKTKQKKALAWEKKLLGSADGIVMMSSSRDSYKKMGVSPDYLAKTEFLDLPLLIPRETPDHVSHRSYFPEDEIVFLFAGSTPRNIRNPEFFLKLFAGIDRPDWHLYLAGNSDFNDLIGSMAGKCTRIHRLGPVEHFRVTEMIREADVMVNIGNTLAHMVPSKIFEYMSFNKPIVSTYRIDDDPCLPYLDHYGRAVAIDEKAGMAESTDAIKSFVKQMVDDPASKAADDLMKTLVKKGGAMFNNTPEAFAEYLERSYARKR
jgi:glycosyltransferase involved in cell wall biosynthesis